MLRNLFTCVAFISRLPVPQRWQIPPEGDFSVLPRYFPAAGAVIGLVNAALAVTLASILPAEIAIALLALFMTVIAGAFHEDGFADVADAMGAYTIERRFEIMKDPRLGTFGVSALICLFLIRYVCYRQILAVDPINLAIMLVLLGASMRWVSVVMLQLLVYTHGPGKGIGTGLKRAGWINLSVFAALLGGAWFAFIPTALAAFSIASALSLVGCYLFFKRNFGGANGDCLGASAIVFEIVLLSAYSALS